jgi:hypothetical protein
MVVEARAITPNLAVVSPLFVIPSRSKMYADFSEKASKAALEVNALGLACITYKGARLVEANESLRGGLAVYDYALGHLRDVRQIRLPERQKVEDEYLARSFAHEYRPNRKNWRRNIHVTLSEIEAQNDALEILLGEGRSSSKLTDVCNFLVHQFVVCRDLSRT